MAKSEPEEETVPLERMSGANLTAIKKMLAKDKKDYLANKDRIAELNADNSAIRKRAVANGIPAKAFTHAMSRAEMEADKREAYDHGYEIASEAFGHPIDLLTPLDEELDKNPKSTPKPTSAVAKATKAASKKSDTAVKKASKAVAKDKTKANGTPAKDDGFSPADVPGLKPSALN